MTMTARLPTVLTQLCKSLFLNGRDALNPGALPLSDERLVQPKVLQQLLREDGLGVYRQLGAIESARLLDIQSISSNCNNRVLGLEYMEGAAAGPATMFLKMPVRSLATRFFFNVIMVWELECEFYRKLAPRLPVRTPQAYSMTTRGSRFVMLMENLHDDPSVVLHTNQDMISGVSIDLARRCLATMARIHAEFHELAEAEREALLPLRLQPFNSPVMRAITPLMGRTALNNCLRSGAIELSAAQQHWYQRAINNWDYLVDYWGRGPLTLVHGDSHIGNHFLHGDEAGMLDWQAAQWGQGIRDVQYFLTDSLPADVLAANEQALVEYYLELLASHGVVLDFADVWYQYRGFSFQTWMTIVVSMGFGAMTEHMDELMPEIHRRCLASIERLQLGSWLDEVLADA